MRISDLNAQANSKGIKANPALEGLHRFVGEWEVELQFPTDPPGKVSGEASFEWLEEGAFLLERLGNSMWLIGRDEASETYSALYYDERGVSRVYQMSLEGGIWKQWRNAPGFSQRFEAKFSEDGNTITAHWDKSTDGSNWERDFDLIYTRIMMTE